MKLSIRPPALSSLAPQLRPLLAAPIRSYATHKEFGLGTTSSPAPRRKIVTPFNDDGRVPWSELSAGEKTARATQQSFNFGLIAVAAVLTGGVAYFLYTDVFSPDSKTAYFNRAVDRIKQDPDCLAALGDAKKMTAFGDETSNSWRRARPITSSHKTDRQGNEHLLLHFYVRGPLNTGNVNVHLTKLAGTSDFEYKYLYVDVPGHQRIYLENADATSSKVGSKKFKLFGASWN